MFFFFFFLGIDANFSTNRITGDALREYLVSCEVNADQLSSLESKFDAVTVIPDNIVPLMDKKRPLPSESPRRSASSSSAPHKPSLGDLVFFFVFEGGFFFLFCLLCFEGVMVTLWFGFVFKTNCWYCYCWGWLVFWSGRVLRKKSGIGLNVPEDEGEVAGGLVAQIAAISVVHGAASLTIIQTF